MEAAKVDQGGSGCNFRRMNAAKGVCLVLSIFVMPSSASPVRMSAACVEEGEKEKACRKKELSKIMAFVGFVKLRRTSFFFVLVQLVQFLSSTSMLPTTWLGPPF